MVVFVGGLKLALQVFAPQNFTTHQKITWYLPAGDDQRWPNVTRDDLYKKIPIFFGLSDRTEVALSFQRASLNWFWRPVGPT